MINCRQKGQRTFQKAVKWVTQDPRIVVIPLYQVSRFAQPQPFDMIVLRPTKWVRFVEVRTNAWGMKKPSTVALAHLPGSMYVKQIWMWTNGRPEPTIRQWSGSMWVDISDPWEGS